MKHRLNRPRGPGFYAAAFAAALVFSLAGCGDALDDGNTYFEFDSATGIITGYDDDGPKEVTIPATIGGAKVTVIGKNALKGKQLTEVVILDNIITIEEGAFAENKLTSAVMIDKVVTIGAGAFEDNLLSEIEIPDSVTTIGEQAFANNRLTGVIIGGGVIFMGKEAFAGGNQLSEVKIPDSVIALGKDVFTGNPLTRVTIGPNKDYAENIVPAFGAVYNGHGKQAGTYTLDGTDWTKL